MTSEPAESKAVQYHGTVAGIWEAQYKADIFNVRLQVLSSLLPNVDGQQWLDAGCGTGTIARFLAERGARVTAIDASQEMLSNVIPEGDVEYLNRDIGDTRLEDRRFAGIVCSSVIEYVEEPEAILREFRRILKKGGLLLISVPVSSWRVRFPLVSIYWMTRPLGAKRWFTYLDHSKHCFSPENLTSLLHTAGFRVDGIAPLGALDLPLGLRLPYAPLQMALAVSVVG
jgi:2-polyprenyl-3-methyl-5-hydroxy-6-metoxy-1,4-benzoquinol methylase